MKIREILNSVNIINIKGDMDRDVSSIHYDSRRLGYDSLFVAVKGLKSDGHNFLEKAIKSGAKGIVLQAERFKELNGFNGIDATYIGVHDSRKTLAIISDTFYGHPSKNMAVIGITGTNGKTTTSYLIDSVLKKNDFKTGIVGTINYRFDGEIIPAPHTTPESLDLQCLLKKMVDRGIKYCVMEVSSHSLELDRVYGVRFETGVFTNLTQDHLDFHITFEKYFDAKAKLFREYGLKKAVINIDDIYGKRLLRDIGADKILTYGITEKADVIARDIVISMQGLKFKVESPIGEFGIRSKLIGRHNVYNILASIATAILEELSEKCIVEGILSTNGIPGRLEKIDEGQDFTVLVDYAHTDDALKNVLKSARELPHNKLILVFGCGGDRDKGKRPLMGRVGIAYSDFVIITSDNPRSEEPLEIIEEIERGVKLTGANEERYIKIPDRREAIELSIRKASNGDMVVIAGKGHEDYQIIGDKKNHFDDREVVIEAIRKNKRIKESKNRKTLSL